MKRVLCVFLILMLIVSAFSMSFTASMPSNGYTDEAADWFVKTALAEVGYREKSGNNTKYGQWFGSNYTGWCSIFTAWCANQTDIKYGTKTLLAAVPKQAGCTGGMNWYKNNGLYKTRSSGYKPKKGDLVYFDWNPGSGLDHVGIVTGTSVSGGVTYVNTVEGNMSDMVKTRQYKLSSANILGYGLFDSSRVDYSKCAPKNPPAPPVKVPQNIPVSLSRLAGYNRFETAGKIAQTGWSQSDAVILATSKSYKDALTGASLSGLYDAPILITEGGSKLESTVAERIKALRASNVIIVGGPVAVSDEIEAELKTSYNVVRIAGYFDSSVEAANHLIANSPAKVDTAIVVNGGAFTDALSISPVSAIGQYPIFFTDGSSLTNGVKSVLKDNGISNILLIGGTSVISTDISDELKSLGCNVKRIAGFNRYSTCSAIYKEYKNLFGNDYAMATGENYPDALAGGAFAAKNRTALLLTAHNSVPSEISSVIKSNAGTKKLYLIGGEGVLPENSIRMIYA